MSYREVINLADNFIIKLAANEDVTNPGGKDIGTPEYVASSEPIQIAPEKTHFTEPGIKHIPEKLRSFTEDLFNKTNKVFLEITNDYDTLKHKNYFNQPTIRHGEHIINRKNAKNHYKNIMNQLSLLKDNIYKEPIAAANKIMEIISANENNSDMYSADIIGFLRDQLYKENIIPGSTLKVPRAQGLWHLKHLKYWIEDHLPR